MIEFFKQFMERRRDRQFVAGFDWAAGALLRGDETQASVEARCYGSADPFAGGARTAVRIMRNRGVLGEITS